MTETNSSWPTFTRDVQRCGAVPSSTTRGTVCPGWLLGACLVASLILLWVGWGHSTTATILLIANVLFIIIAVVKGEHETYAVPAGSATARVIDHETGCWPRAAVDSVLQARGLQKIETEKHQDGSETKKVTGTVATGVTPLKDGDLILHLRLGPGVSHAQLDSIQEQLARALRVTRADGGASTGVSSGETKLLLTMRNAPVVPETLDDEWS